ncbi:MAG: hypothetical protein WCV70_00570 [Patescibacteria group bacterium]|jgi:hypothetical protein
MNDLTKNKRIGLIILCFTVIVFFLSILFFNQSGTYIQYKNLNYMVKMLIPYGLAILGLYFGLFFASGKKVANQVGIGLLTLLIIAYILGILIHKN